MIIYTIYKVVNLINGKVYIGYTNDFDVRKKNHINQTKKKKTIFHKALFKYGLDNFEWIILYQSKEKDHTLKVMENYFISEFNSMLPFGYNTCQGGGGGTISEKSLYRMKHDNPMVKLRHNNGTFKKGNKPITYDDTNEKKRVSKLGSKNPNYQKVGNWNNVNKIKFNCLHCDTSSTKGNIVRWHNDNCKHKPL